MSNKVPFKPVVGIESQILNSNPSEGYVWFATDSKKIYYSDGKSFLSMGGNTGIYYGNMVPELEPDTDKTDFIFEINDIDGNENVSDGNFKKPNVDDLILNIPDGCFYRVIEVLNENNILSFLTEKLTIAGNGAGPGGSTGAGALKIIDVDGTVSKYYTQDSEEAVLRFNVSSTNPTDNGISKITYTMPRSVLSEPIVDETWREFGIVEFDILKYIPKMSTSTGTQINIQVEDMYGVKKSITYYINVIKISLESVYTEDILTTTQNILSYSCKPIGGLSLTNKQILVSFYDEFNNLNSNIIYGDDNSENLIINEDNNLPIEIPNIGSHIMRITYRGQLPNGDWVSSNALVYTVVYYDANPQLVVSVPPTQIEQYSTLEITYMVVAITNSVNQVDVSLIKGTNSSIQKVDYNKKYTWSIYFDQTGVYDLAIEALGVRREFNNIVITPYKGTIPSIHNSGLTVNLSAVNRSNTELDKDIWISTGTQPVKCEFENFSWGDINGWQKDENNINVLHLSSGAKLTLKDFSPYDINAMSLGQTIELDFKFSGVTDFLKPLIHCLSYDNNNNIQVGFQLTGQESTLNTYGIKATGSKISEDEEDQVYNTQIQGLTAKFIENERIHLTWVVETDRNNKPMIRTYLNGILSGITQYDKDADSMIENILKPARLIIDSTYGNIDIYNIRIYKESTLSPRVILNNYIATYGSTEDKTIKYIDNISLLADDNTISISKIETENDNSGYKLSVPYIKILGGKSLSKDDDSGNYYINTSDIEQHLPTAKKDYRLIKQLEFVDHSGKRQNYTVESNFENDGHLNGIVMYGQGTSSMEYPVKNLRFKSKLRDSDGNKFEFTVNDCNIDLVCLKADYMESSGSHNTGTGNLIYTLTKNIVNMETPGQTYYKDKVDYDVVTAIRGFPVMLFFKTEDADEYAPYEFIGKYNFNLDKATQEPFGLYPTPENMPASVENTFGWAENNDTSLSNLNPEDHPFINTIHCYEFLNNASNLANFCKEEGEDFETSFYKIVNSDGKNVPNWFTAYESRYPEGESKTGADIDINSFFRLCNWLNSTNPEEATGNILETPYTYNGEEYSIDSSEYRKAKFKKEFNDYLNFDFTAFYYILTHVLLMIDSRAKNMMLATWDNRIWYPIFYDMDTMLGLNNYGYNKFNYDVEDDENRDKNIYNGRKSVLWNNFRDTFADEIKAFYQKMQTAGLNYNNLLMNYNKDQADAVNEAVYNADSQYKYIRPFSEGFIDSSGDEVVEVAPGTRDYLYASQGSRSMHRKWWLKNRINYFNGKYLSDAYKADRYIMRLYTPSPSEDNYYAVLNSSKEEFDAGLYYLKDQEDNFTPAIGIYNSNLTYYKKADNRLTESVKELPPNNDFILTPLYNQYLSIAYGGNNGRTTEPKYTEANSPTLIEAPAGAEYNDTETYVYGGSTLKDLGDLSYQYLGQFHFPSEITKLETLTLGNKNNKYFNPNFSSLTIGSSAPYLKVLELTNCSGLGNQSQNVSQCQNLQKLYATGTGLTAVTLPSYGVLNELRLPSTLQNLTIISQPELTDENFTIGTYDSVTDTYTNVSGSLTKLQVQNTPIDTYSLVKNNQATLQWFYLTDIQWRAEAEDIDKNNLTLEVLEILLRENITPVIGLNLTKQQALTGTITIPSGILTEAQALELYNKYVNVEKFPNIDFIFEGLNIHNVKVVDGNNNICWTRKIGGTNNTITKDFLSGGPYGIFETPVMNPTVSHIYTFDNEWTIEGGSTPVIFNGSTTEDTYGWPINTNYGVESDITLVPSFTPEIRKYQISFINTYDDSFDPEGEFLNMEVKYGTKINGILPPKIPYRDDSQLAFDKTYSFEGYHIEQNSKVGIDFTDEYKVTNSKTYYAIFKESSVYDNIHEDYFTSSGVKNYIDAKDSSWNVSGHYIRPQSNLELKGKITIPSTYKGSPVIGIDTDAFAENNNITHVFIQSPNTLRSVNDNCFKGCNNLQYFEFTDELRNIGSWSFAGVPLKPNSGLTLENNYDRPSYTFGNNLYKIGSYGFNTAFNSNNQPAVFYLPASLTVLDYFAISNIEENVGYNSELNIGSPEKASQLDLSLTAGGSNDSSGSAGQCIRNNTGAQYLFNIINLYHPIYKNEEDIIINTVLNQTYSVKDAIGNGSGEIIFN